LSSREEVGSAGWRVRIEWIFPRQPASASEILPPSEDGFQIPAGLADACASALPLDACDSCLPHFLMRCLQSEDCFLFTSYRFGFLHSGALASVFLSVHARPLVSLGLATLFHLEKELGVLAGRFESSRSFTTSQPPHRDPFLYLAILFQISVGLARYASAPCRPLDA